MAYLDTSALLKWYVPERGSEEFGDWIALQGQAEISRLTSIEVRSTLAKKVRTGQLSRDESQQALERFLADVEDGLFTLCIIRDEDWLVAENLIQAMTTQAEAIPLRSLDALHLAIAQSRQVNSIATADHVLAKAADQLGMQSILF